MLLKASPTSLVAGRVARLSLCAWLVGCGCGASHPAPDAATDGGVDSGRDAAGDSGRDASRDARPDTGRDTGIDAAHDTGVDAGLDSDWLGCDPGWRPMPGLDPDLTIYYATNPSCLLPIVWESCGTGCQRLVDDPRVQRAIAPGMSWTDGERHLFSLVEGNAGLRTLDANVITAVASAEGTVYGAWRGSAGGDRSRIARVGATGGGNGWLGFEMPADRFTPAGNFASYDERLYHAPLAALTGPLEPVMQLAPPIVSVTDAAQPVAASDTTLAAEVHPRGQVLVVEHAARHWLGGRGSATPAIPQGVFVVGPDVYWMDYFESYPGVRLAHGTWSTESEVFYDIPGVDLLGFASDGHDFAWVQGYDYGDAGYARLELWTAPYTSDKSALVPRQVPSAFISTPRGVVGAGMYAASHLEGARDVKELYSLSDGSVRQWRVPADWYFDAGLLWITADEVAYGGHVGATGQRTVFRLSIADTFTAVP